MSTEVVSRFLDMQALAALQHMRFSTKHRIEGTYSGRHKSRQKGGAGEFVDYREYSSGEDLRHIDWKVLARSGKAYIRLFQEETNLVCTLAVDASRSMDFGAGENGGHLGTKLEYAQYLSTALSHVINRGQDRVGLAVLTDKLADLIEPGATRSHLSRIHEAIERLTTSPTTTMAQGMRTLFERSKSRGVLMLMSDFLFDDLDEVFAVVRLFRHRQWEVVALHLVHPDEEQLPEGAAYRFEGLENDGRIDCSPNEIRDLYRARFEAHVAMVRTLALATGCDYRRTSTGISYLKVLGDFLVERSS